MTFLTHQKHDSNNLDMSGPGLAKHVFEEGIILMLASTKFPVTSFLWKTKNTTSEDVNIENWWVPSSLETLKKAHVVRNLICKTFPPKKTWLLSSIVLYRLLNKKQLNPNKYPNFFPAEMCGGARGSGGSGFFFVVRREKCSFARSANGLLTAPAAAMAALWLSEALWGPLSGVTAMWIWKWTHIMNALYFALEGTKRKGRLSAFLNTFD